MEVPSQPVLKDRQNYRYVGKPILRKNGPTKVTGTAQYGNDKAELGGDRVLDVEYELPYLVHATMEPMNFTAVVCPDRCTVLGAHPDAGTLNGQGH